MNFELCFNKKNGEKRGVFYKKSLLLYNEKINLLWELLCSRGETEIMKNHEIPLREKSIVFVGFMGVGKTTIGKLVAKKLYRDFVDIDEKIEKEFGMPTTKIFETFGEKTFRERNNLLLLDLSEQPLNVISVGGGAFLNEEISKACLANCLVIFSRFIMGFLERTNQFNY